MNVKSTIQWATPFSPTLLLGLAVAALAGFALLRWASGRPIAPARRRALLVLRLLILAVLAVILINPVRVDETPGAVERPKVFYLVDASQSMALGKGQTRWDHVARLIRDAEKGRDPRLGAQVSAFRFGTRLALVEDRSAPTDDDTLVGDSLEALADRFGQVPPQAVVLFSDGRARDPERADLLARAYGKMKVPVHVVPVGDADVGGDIAVVSLVAPNLVRKHSHVAAQVFVRSHGYQGKRADLKIVSVRPDGTPGAVLAREPIVLRDGLFSAPIGFESGDDDRRIEARIEPQPGEVSASNNAFGIDMAIDHTKIRVLYLEGAVDRYVAQAAPGSLAAPVATVKGAYSSLQEALMEDPDIECTAVMPGGAAGDFSNLVRIDERTRGLPETPSELLAYDAIILSNVPRDALTDQHLAWIDEWIGRRGGGLCMVGGPNSFASGGWADTAVGKMLPVDLAGPGPDWDDALTVIRPVAEGPLHPIWHITSDDSQNRALLKTLPDFLGANRLGRAKPGAEVLALSGASGDPRTALAVQPYGRGRALAFTAAITRRWARDFTQSWGGDDARYYQKFWRNVVYWLTENSSIGRRRLLAETDKRLYRPGEPIVVRARTFDENAAPTLDYRVAVSVEPKSAESVTSDDSPLRRPSAPDGKAGPLLPWGAEFDLARQPSEKTFGATLPIVEAKAVPAGMTLTQGLRIELTAYENNTQVDSTALEVQVLDDPSEQQNPLPDHDLLRRVAKRSGGTVLRGPDDLSALIARLPRVVGPSEIKKVPAWSRGWLLALLLGLLTVEWVCRRRLGLA